ncbi:MAG: hypothetical protein ACREEL_09845 [Stellaceae bacterium]
MTAPGEGRKNRLFPGCSWGLQPPHPPITVAAISGWISPLREWTQLAVGSVHGRKLSQNSPRFYTLAWHARRGRDGTAPAVTATGAGMNGTMHTDGALIVPGLARSVGADA